MYIPTHTHTYVYINAYTDTYTAKERKGGRCMLRCKHASQQRIYVNKYVCPRMCVCVWDYYDHSAECEQTQSSLKTENRNIYM